MWIFTKYGFFSVVEGSSSTLLIRARSKQHLSNLKSGFRLKNKIRTTHKADYRYRLELPKKEGLKLFKQLCEDITYPNFKNEVEGTGLCDFRYHDVLLDLWWTMYNYQKESY